MQVLGLDQIVASLVERLTGTSAVRVVRRGRVSVLVDIDAVVFVVVVVTPTTASAAHVQIFARK